MTTPEQSYQLPELVVCTQLDADVLTSIEATLLARRESGGQAAAQLHLTQDGKVVSASEAVPTDEFMEIASSIKKFQKARNGLLGTLALHAAIVPFQVAPNWHSEPFNDAFVATTAAATEGLSGRVPGSYWAEAARYVEAQAEADPEFADHPLLRIVRPPLYSLLHIPSGTYHRSPRPAPDLPAEKLLINAVMMPSFMRLV